jgi:hypothetical protein
MQLACSSRFIFVMSHAWIHSGSGHPSARGCGWGSANLSCLWLLRLPLSLGLQLGDGAAMSLGEVVNRRGERWELQFKGSGPTPYSRRADGAGHSGRGAGRDHGHG